MTCGSYTSDLTSGKTFSASSVYLNSASYAASKAFDNDNGTSWISGGGSNQWIQVQFSAAQAIVKITVRCESYNNTASPKLYLKASNTGAFSGEEVTVWSGESISWTYYGELKQWEFDNENAYTYYRLIGTTTPNTYHAYQEIEMMACAEISVDIGDAAGVGDSSDGFNLTDGISDAAGVGDSADAYNTDSPIADTFGTADSADAFGERTASGSDVTGVGDAADAGCETERVSTDSAGFDDSSDGFNYTAWFRANRDRAVVRYYCTLTGAPDGLSDLTIPISSFQARKRTGESTYLSVAVPGMALAGDIADRSNGELVIDMAYLLDGVESLREEILRVELEQINPQEGARNRTITLSGHKTTTYDARAVSIQGANYKYTSDGSLGFRFPQADPYLNPGDALTVIDTEDVFTVDYITYAISARGAKFMEVREG